MANYQTNNFFDSFLYDSCSVSSDCLTLTCINNNTERQFEDINRLVVNFLPCGGDGRKPGARLTLTGFLSNTILNQVFYESDDNVDIGGNGVMFGVTVEPLGLGIRFGVRIREWGGSVLLSKWGTRCRNFHACVQQHCNQACL
jgi:hypothetical protein